LGGVKRFVVRYSSKRTEPSSSVGMRVLGVRRWVGYARCDFKKEWERIGGGEVWEAEACGLGLEIQEKGPGW